jgi:hypothetical protein
MLSSIGFNGEVSLVLHHLTKTIECLQRAKQGDARARTALFVPRRRHLKQLSARLPARLLPEIIDLSVVMRKAMLDAAIVRQQPLFDYPWMRQLPAERLIELHRRNLRSQRLKVNREYTRIQQSSHESPPHYLIKKRIYGIDSSNPNCQRNAAVDSYVQPLSCGPVWVVASGSKEGTIGHCEKNL